MACFPARIPLIDLAQKMNMSIENCSYHLNYLKKKKFIKKFSIVIDGKRLHKTWSIIMLKINPK